MPPKTTTKAKTPQPQKGALAMLKQQKAPLSAPPGKTKPALTMDSDSESDKEEDAALFANIKSSLFQKGNLLKEGAGGSESDEDMDDDSDDEDMEFSDMDDDDEEEEDEDGGEQKDSSIHTTRSGLRRQMAASKALMVNGKSKAVSEVKNTSTPLPVSEKKAKTAQTKKADTPNVKSIKPESTPSAVIKAKIPTVKTPTVKTPVVQKKSETPAAEKAKTPKSAKLKEQDKTANVISPTKGIEANTSDISAVTPAQKKQKKANLSERKQTPARKRKSQDDDKDSQDSGVVMTTNSKAAAKVQAELDRRTLFIKNLPPLTEEAELRNLSQDIQTVRIKGYKPSYAFLEYASEAIAEKNYKKLTGKKIGKHVIAADYVGEKSKYKKSDRRINPLRLYIGGYSSSTSADEIRHLFRTADSIDFPKHTKGFCFASYDDTPTAKAAYEKGKSLKLNNMKLIVDYARGKRSERADLVKSSDAKTDKIRPVKKAKLEIASNQLDESDEDDDDYKEGEDDSDEDDESDDEDADEEDDDDK